MSVITKRKSFELAKITVKIPDKGILNGVLHLCYSSLLAQGLYSFFQNGRE